MVDIRLSLPSNEAKNIDNNVERCNQVISWKRLLSLLWENPGKVEIRSIGFDLSSETRKITRREFPLSLDVKFGEPSPAGRPRNS
jgi:hypothetical protein